MRKAGECGVYVLRNTANGKVYVGQSIHIHARICEHRIAARRGDKSHLYDAMRRYGADAFVCAVLEECAPARLDEREALWMAEFDCRNPERGYNLMPAGQRGRVMDEAMRRRMSERARSYKATPETIEKMRAASTGRRHSDETKAKISRAHKGRVVSAETAQKVATALKRRWAAMTEREKAEYAAVRSGWSHSEALKQAVSERFKGKPKTEEQRARMSAAAKARSPEADARRLEALRIATKARWEQFRREKLEAVCP